MPTDRQNYLHAKSAHPLSLKKEYSLQSSINEMFGPIFYIDINTHSDSK